MGILHTTITVILVAVGAYGVGTLIAQYDGPFNLFIKLRKLGKLFSCATCLGFWVAIGLSLLAGLGFIETVAAIGLMIILTREL